MITIQSIGLFKGSLSGFSFLTTKVVIFWDLCKYLADYFRIKTGVYFTREHPEPEATN